MVAFNAFFSSVYLAVVCASLGYATPLEQRELPLSTHSRREVGSRGLAFNTYNPPATYETFGAGEVHVLSKRQDAPIEEVAVEIVKEKLGLSDDEVAFKSGSAGDATEVGYVRQKKNGIEFANAVANVAIKDDKLIAFGSSFVKPAKVASAEPSVSVKDAIAAAEKALEGKYNDHPTALEYLVQEDNTAILTHVVQIQNQSEFTWYEAYVDAHSGKVVSVVDFVADATFRALPINKEYPTEGFETLVNPEDLTASPQGWLNDGSQTYTRTNGNNVYSYKVISGAETTAPQTSATGPAFVYNWDGTTVDPTLTNPVNTALVNTFYTANAMHDFLYKYGFTESSWNFQTNNWGKGGSGNDKVRISVQDAGGTNNANFATPPDGQSGQMRMYLWTYTTPRRDGALENDIVIHEYGHGVSNRLTGGGTGRCLQTTEAGGMGEGWSDSIAYWAAQKSATIVDFKLAEFVKNAWDIPNSLRAYPYSTSSTTNPLQYANVRGQTSVHAIGTIWANILFNIHAELINQYGFSAESKTNADTTHGNVVWFRLFIDSLKLQPCNPTFVRSRDAWIQADATRYGGKHRCLLWKQFAARGLGSGAVSGTYTNNYSVPTDCA